MAAQVRPIHRLLVANRGEIARRVFRTARTMGISTVAVYADPDADAPHVLEADLAVALTGVTAAETYLDIPAVLAAAERSGADSVHPGYGFLSENATFAQAVVDAGLVWVGPPPEAIEQMGDKLAALDRMRAAGVPTLPRATCDAGTDLATAAKSVGFPLLVKASSGGGGKGMRVVATEQELADAVYSARREAGRAFGRDVVFLERYLDPARHIEVQIMGDRDGRVRHVYERECSIQRRHQKVIEEAPSPFLDDETRQRMYTAAVAAGEAVSYRGAGTVEFVVDADGGFYFLEMNTRLQVEHPVTELITGLDLVRWQLLVAQGLELDGDVPPPKGSAIEARIYAEDPGAGFLPSSGRLIAWSEPSDVRVDSGVAQGDTVSAHYDPMLAKVIAHAPTRREATAVLARALRALRVHGPSTNRQFLVNALAHPDFADGRTTTGFIADHADELTSRLDDASIRLAAASAVLAGSANRVVEQSDRLDVPAAWRNNPGPGEQTGFIYGERTIICHHRQDTLGEYVVTCQIDDVASEHRVRILDWSAPWLDLRTDGLRRRCTVHHDDARVWVQDDDTEIVFGVLPRFPDPHSEEIPGGMTAPMNGTVAAVQVAPGDAVTAGQTLVILEAMKMEHRITAPVDGEVAEVLVTAGRSVGQDDLLVVLTTPED